MLFALFPLLQSYGFGVVQMLPLLAALAAKGCLLTHCVN